MLMKQVKVRLLKHQQQNKQTNQPTNKNENNQCTAHDYQLLTAKIWNQLRHYRLSSIDANIQNVSYTSYTCTQFFDTFSI